MFPTPIPFVSQIRILEHLPKHRKHCKRASQETRFPISQPYGGWGRPRERRGWSGSWEGRQRDWPLLKPLSIPSRSDLSNQPCLRLHPANTSLGKGEEGSPETDCPQTRSWFCAIILTAFGEVSGGALQTIIRTWPLGRTTNHSLRGNELGFSLKFSWGALGNGHVSSDSDAGDSHCSI